MYSKEIESVPIGHTFFSWQSATAWVALEKLPETRPTKVRKTEVGGNGTVTHESEEKDQGKEKGGKLALGKKKTKMKMPQIPDGHTQYSWGIVGLEAHLRASEVNRMGRSMQAIGKLDLAVCLYQTALRLDTSYANVLFNLGTVMGRLGFHAASLSCFDCAATCKVGFVEALYNAGAQALKLNKVVESVIYCERALEANGNCSEACWNYASALRRADRRGDAIRFAWSRLLSRHPRFEPCIVNVRPSAFIRTYHTRIHVVCVKWGRKYGPEYVNRLARGVSRHLKMTKHDFHCFTDDVEGIDGDIVKTHSLGPESKAFTGWWSKAVVLFGSCSTIRRLEEDITSPCRILYIDLDTIITGSLDEIAGYTGQFAILGTENLDSEGCEGGYNSSLMILDAGFGQEILRNIKFVGLDRVRHFVHRLDHWLEMNVRGADILQNLYPGQIIEYKHDVVGNNHVLPENARVVNFPLHPKPHHISSEPWVQTHWISN